MKKGKDGCAIERTLWQTWLKNKLIYTVPSVPPDDVRCAALTSQSLQVSWQPPPNAHSNGIIQGYKLHYEPVLADMWRSVDEMEVSIN